MLEKCPCFERSDDTVELSLKPELESGTPYRDRGTLIHEAFGVLLQGKMHSAWDELTPEEKEQVEWAVDQVKMLAHKDHPIEIEKQLVLMNDEFHVVTFGTGDVVNGPRLFDLKTGDYHDYWLQMAAYALMQMDRIGIDEVEVNVLFSRHKKVQTVRIRRMEASIRIFDVVAAVLSPHKKPRANPYCKWCRKIMTCEAVIHLASGVEVERYAIDDPETLSIALKTAKLLKTWAEKVEAHARNLAMAGTEIPFFELKSRAGAREILDVKRAYELSGLPPNKFLSLCSVSVGSVEDAIAINESIPKAKAKRVVNERLGEVMQRRAPTVHLSQIKSDEPTER